MKPTPKLRFVERDCYSRNGEHFLMPFQQRVLQQWYEWDVTYPTQSGEWRDVPLEKENE